ncbi:MAG: acyl--CoA ligase [Actinomycetales bacterium]|nr:acyl--CoA ligase [Actinomycetales bacterium]
MTDLVRAVLAALDARPEAPALTAGRETLSGARLAGRIRRVAAGLAAEGLRPGERVLFSVRPGADALVLALGIVLARGVVVFADPGAGAALFRARAALAAPRWIAAESLLYLASSGPLRPLARRRGLELAPYSRLLPEARHVSAGRRLPGVPRGALALGALARSAAPAVDEAAADPSDDALVIFTSGTTDAPRAVAHTRGSLGAGLADFAAAVVFAPGERVLTDQLMVGVPALIAGAHWMLPPPGLDPGAAPKRYLAALPATEALFASPAGLDAILRLLDERPALAARLGGLRTLVLGGAPVLRPLLERARARFPGARIRCIYGMTEVLPVAIADGDEKLRLLRADPSGGDPVGRVVPSVTARIDDGELVLSGPGLARGYLAELPDHPLTEVRTGDLARLDRDLGPGVAGDLAPQLRLLGRRKEMFLRGTQNVYPGLYEPIVAGLPGVRDAAMVGVPDAIGDDRLVLAVETVPAATRLDPAHPVARAVSRALPGLLDAGVLPDLVLAVPALPRSGRSRKLDRAALARLVAPLLPAEGGALDAGVPGAAAPGAQPSDAGAPGMGAPGAAAEDAAARPGGAP